MTRTQAVNLALAAMRQKIKALAFDANLYTVYGARTHAPVRAYQEREKLKRAVEMLEGKDKE